MIFTGAVAANCKAIAGAMAAAVLSAEALLAVVMGLVAGEGGGAITVFAGLYPGGAEGELMAAICMFMSLVTDCGASFAMRAGATWVLRIMG